MDYVTLIFDILDVWDVLTLIVNGLLLVCLVKYRNTEAFNSSFFKLTISLSCSELLVNLHRNLFVYWAVNKQIL